MAEKEVLEESTITSKRLSDNVVTNKSRRSRQGMGFTAGESCIYCRRALWMDMGGQEAPMLLEYCLGL